MSFSLEEVALWKARSLLERGQRLEASAAYRDILATSPNQHEAWQGLALIAMQEGRFTEAVNAFARVVELRPNDLNERGNLAIALSASGRDVEARSEYERILKVDPTSLVALINLGNLEKSSGRLDRAADLFRRSADAAPDMYQAASNYGSILLELGKIDQAIAKLSETTRRFPQIAPLHFNLANALQKAQRLEEAANEYLQALQLAPDRPDIYLNFGHTLRQMGELPKAIHAYACALKAQPNFMDAEIGLGTALSEVGDFDNAIARFTAVLEAQPDHPLLGQSLAKSLSESGRLDDAFSVTDAALLRRPDDPALLSIRGSLLREVGRLDDSLTTLRQATEIAPGDVHARSNLVFLTHFHPDFNAATLRREAERWDEQFGNPLRATWRPHGNNREPNRRLKIGYLSTNLYQHVVGHNLTPLLREHDHAQFEIFAYADHRPDDEVTTLLRSYCDHWRSVTGYPPDQIVAQIRADEIDVLIDTQLHMAPEPLLVFARRPAPVQITHFGYPGTTGLAAMDYRFSDVFLDPPNQHDADYSEKTIRGSSSFWCYEAPSPLAASQYDVAPQPFDQNGYITFGCQNNFCKISEQSLRLWAQVLAAVPNSRMIVRCPKGAERDRVTELLGGLSPDRLSFTERLPIAAYLRRSGDADIMLDSLPYNGHTTSLDALWMGVPVVTLVGRTVVGRAGLSQLSNLGLTELIARDEGTFVRIAVELANDLPRLRDYRRTLRDRMLQSPLCDAVGFARGFESAIREAWRAWASKSGS